MSGQSFLRGIHHVSLKTDDPERFEEALRFYRDLLGCRIDRRWDAGVLLDTGGGWIEIFSNGPGIADKGAVRHAALAVTDTDALAARLEAAGYPCFLGPRDLVIPSDPPLRARIAFLRGPLGEEIELFQEM
ncbi:MAG: VOC family protein [Clostridia bacterium]|nr:VOC family protein [Clostridia bacterium]